MSHLPFIGMADQTRLDYVALTSRTDERGQQAPLLLLPEQGVMPSTTPCTQQSRRPLLLLLIAGVQMIDRTNAPAQRAGDLGGGQPVCSAQPNAKHTSVVGLGLNLV